MFDFEKGCLKFILGGKYPHCHTLFVDDRRTALIDAASREDTLKAIHARRPVDILIASHGHEDHIMYNYLFPEAEFWVHEADAHIFLDIENLLDCYAPTDTERAAWRELLVTMCHYEVREASRLLNDGDILDFGATHCEVIHTPGHTPGHCAFHFPQERVLFMADMDLVKGGPYYGDVNSSLEETLASLERLSKIDVDTYLTAHGPGIYDGDPDYIVQYIRTVEKREAALLEFLSGGPKTLGEVTEKGIIYGPGRVVSGWDLSTSERSMMGKHLHLLIHQGRVIQEGDLFALS
ncbi:MAG: MBL fold metallo-hydrolase [Deltaproteobacteria bacterium]|nr:MBL fold metallo-hydrolase [Deltaproteobacteria bacterium]